MQVDATAVLDPIVYGSKDGGTEGKQAQTTAGFGSKSLPLIERSQAVTDNSVPRHLKAATSTSAFKGVTRHRSTGKYEAHLWDSSHIRIAKVTLLLYMEEDFVLLP